MDEIDSTITLLDVTTNTKYPTNQTSPNTPALTCFQNRLVVAWRSTNSSGEINVGDVYCGNAGSGIGCDIAGTLIPHAFTDEPPTIAGGNGYNAPLYLGWVGLDPKHHLNLQQLYSYNGSGTAYKPTGPLVTFTDYTHDNASLSFSYDESTKKLWIAFVDANSINVIHLGYYAGSGQNLLIGYGPFSDASQYAPGITASNGTVLFIWKGNTNTHIYTGRWNGSWHGNIQQSDTTFWAPAISSSATAFTGTNDVVYYDLGAYTFP